MAVLTAGVACQFAQTTDPVFPLLYFTIDSAVLGAVALIGSALRPQSLPLNRARGAATLAIVVSGLVYATVIAPATPTGTWFQPWDDTWVRTGTVLLHGLAPALIVTDYLLSPYPKDPVRTSIRVWLMWPLAYLLTLGFLSGIGAASFPYDFLNVDHMAGPWSIIAVLAGLIALMSAISALLAALHKHVPIR